MFFSVSRHFLKAKVTQNCCLKGLVNLQKHFRNFDLNDINEKKKILKF